MFEFLYRMSDAPLFVLLAAFFVCISIVFILIIKYFIPLHVRYDNNSVLGNISGLIGIIYGVLAGLTALYLLNNINYTSDALQREANSIANLYRESKWLTQPTSSHIQAELKIYLNNVIKVEWPLMQRGKDPGQEGEYLINNITDELVMYHAVNSADSLLLHDMIDELKSMYNARELRVQMSFDSLAVEIWVVILIGTILTIGINYLFKISFHLHLISVSAAALMASSMIFLLITLDRPYQGEFGIEPDPFISVLNFIQKTSHTPVKTMRASLLSTRHKKIEVEQ